MTCPYAYKEFAIICGVKRFIGNHLELHDVCSASP
jgi:hypothetical protein